VDDGRTEGPWAYNGIRADQTVEVLVRGDIAAWAVWGFDGMQWEHGRSLVIAWLSDLAAWVAERERETSEKLGACFCVGLLDIVLV
jgi:hypothetical protein